jgi:hypothetical protein
MFSCFNLRKKDNHVDSVKIGDNLFCEYYNVFSQGAFGTGLETVYLTDSLNFRKYIDVCDEGYEYIWNNVISNSILHLYKVRIENNKVDTLWTREYNISQLKKEGKFE